MNARFHLSFLLLASLCTAHAAPDDYRFVSIYSEVSPLNQFSVGGGALNNHGTIAVALAGAQNEQVIYRVNDTQWTVVWRAAVGSFDGFNHFDINDADQIAGYLQFCCVGNADVARLEPDGSLTTLANGFFACESGEFCAFNGLLGSALNDAGEVAIGSPYNFGAGPVNSLWLLGSGNPIEIERQGDQSGDLINFTPPSINNAGVVAFGASQIDGPFGSAYTGTGGAVSFEGMPPYPQGGNIGEAIINDSGQIGVLGNGVHIIADNDVTTVLAAQFGVSAPAPLSFNNNSEVAFLGCIGLICGLFTGSDEVDDAVLRAGDALFDGVVTDGTGSFLFDNKNLNDNSEITFKVQIDVDGEIQSHLVYAIPLSPLYDRDDDGVTNDVDNCLTVDNAAQRDTDGDGFGNFCDADLNNDGIVNPTDLGLFRSVFFSADPDADFNGDGVVNVADLGIIRSRFLVSPGPSALAE